MKKTTWISVGVLIIAMIVVAYSWLIVLGNTNNTNYTNEKSNRINCSDPLSKFTYLNGFSDSDTLNSIKNDDSKLKKMVDQAVANKSLINDPGDPVKGLDEWVVPITRDPLFGQCKWVEHWDTEYCYIYSYKINGRVIWYTSNQSKFINDWEVEEDSPRCNDTKSQKLAMIRAIKDGYCCGGDDYITSPASNTCGNGTIEDNEYCDGSDTGLRTCQTMGYESGILKCTSDCNLDRSSCAKKRDIKDDNIILDDTFD